VKIEGATALLTGATGGIGQAIARALHQRGAKLILSGRRVDVLEPLAAELGARALAVDLASPAEIDRMVREAGEVDILVANAALNVNLRAPIVLAHALAPQMLERGRGQLLFMSSMAGKATTPGASLYSASKYGLRGFASSLRADLHGSGVGVSTVFPGFIRDAGMFADAQDKANVKLPPGVGTRTPEDVADAVVKAIERDRGETDVAPPQIRATAMFAGLAPEIGARVARRLGSEEIAREMAEGQREKR